MKKEEIIRRYGEEEYKRRLAQNRERSRKYHEEHRDEMIAATKKWKEENPEKIIANNQEQCRKDGKYYDRWVKYQQTGIPGDKNKIRNKHRNQYRPYKAIIAPESQIHHEWVPNTSEYHGVALVEAKPHQYGIIDVIEILDGKITLLTEEEVKAGGRKSEN